MGAGLSIFARSPSRHQVLPHADPASAAALPAFLSGKRLGLTSATGEKLAVVLGPEGLEVEVEGSTRSAKRRTTLPLNGLIPYLYVLSASVTATGKLSLATLHERGAGKPLSLWRLESDAAAVDSEQLATWIAELMSRAYNGIQPERRFLVLVNPHGGQGKAQHIWDTIVEPIFAAAGAKPVLHLTGPASSPANATTFAQNLKLDLYDALVPISGDGITSELINGLAARPDALSALQTPISPIPGGSGNALSVNLFGMDRVEDPAFAALNAIKGSPMALDICTVSQGDRITYSFLSQAFGLIADLDIGTEWLRWMGDTRFVVGFLWGVLTRKTYSVELSVKIVESDKAVLVAAHNSASLDTKPLSPSHFASEPHADLTGPFPPSRFGTTTSPLPPSPAHEALLSPLEPGWHTFRMNVQMLYGGKLPWVAKGSMQFPLARDDGLIDLHLVGPRSISASLKAFDGLERGAYLSLPESFYYKVEAFRVTPLAAKGYISIDGESIPHETYQVENHRGLARVMSMRAAPAGSKTIRKGLRRSRKGCLTCRRYHLKCPEVGESCAKCLEAARECVWPDNVLKERREAALVEPSAVATIAELDAPDSQDAPHQALSPASYLLSILSPSIIQPLEPCSLAYPDPTQRRLMHLFVASASKLILNISLQPSTVSFLDLSRLVAAPEPGFSGDALRFSLLGIGALHDAWARGHADAAVLDTTLAVARGMTDAASACLAATVALGSGRIAGGVEETALAAAAMLSYSQVLAGANGKREPLELAYGLIKSGGGFENLLANARAKGEMRKVLEFIAVFDVLDALGTQREPHFFGTMQEVTWWPRTRCETPYQELDSVETTFGVSRDMWSLFARAVRLVARAANSGLYAQAQPTDMLFIHPALFELSDPTEHAIHDFGNLAEAAAVEEDLDGWELSEDAHLALPRALQGNKIYILTAKILLAVWVRGESRTANNVQNHAVSIMGLLVDCHAQFDGVLYFMWPLLIAGSLLDPHLRSLPLNVLDIFSQTYLFDCTAALRALHIVWERVDQHLPNASIQAVVRELGFQFL